jgi:hypothetical protein
LLSGLTASAVLLYLRFHYLTKKLIKTEHDSQLLGPNA